MTRLLQAHELGLIKCQTCGSVALLGTPDEPQHCERCESRMTHRKTSSVQQTLAWLLTGVILYIPANLLPVMHTDGVIGDADSTILSGINDFWHAGEWDIALIIFVASVAVPVTKFVAITWVLVAARTNERSNAARRTKLYRGVEFIGYWSMLDVVVVAITSTLMQFGALGTAKPRGGIIMFCGVVVVTMLAARSFDPRLMWDQPR